MKRALFLSLSLFLIACNKPDPNPELKDPIYLDLEVKKKEIEQQIAGEEKNLEEAAGEVKKAVPQTGQIKFAQKHFFEVQARLGKLREQKKYYEIRHESRKYEAQESYLKAFDKGEAWPDPQELEDYKVQESARTKPRNWSVKGRIQQELPPAAAEGGGEKKKGH